MKVILFGATGMVGQGVLRECLLADDVTEVLSVGRTPLSRADPKLRELLLPSLDDLTPVADQLAGYDACYFCLGVSSVGLDEAAYRRITYDLTLGVARLLAERNPGSTFTYVSGQGTDSSEQGRTMWARVKGKTENDLLALPLETYVFRPGFIQPMNGEGPRTPALRWGYRALAPVTKLATRAFPKYATTTEALGRAMLQVTREKPEPRVLGNPEITRLGR
ncbi:epimerase [Cryptosporangium japonicum]|uniref:Epimerase n=1 Tax=Cryptosporangium japonicum TaxID=80872 RepID=A0ABN0UNP6_9ACTN